MKTAAIKASSPSVHASTASTHLPARASTLRPRRSREAWTLKRKGLSWEGLQVAGRVERKKFPRGTFYRLTSKDKTR